MSHFDRVKPTNAEIALDKATRDGIVTNAEKMVQLVSEIECLAEMIEHESRVIDTLTDYDYSDEIAEELNLDGCECGIISPQSATLIRDLIIRDKKQNIMDWNSDIVFIKKKLQELI